MVSRSSRCRPPPTWRTSSRSTPRPNSTYACRWRWHRSPSAARTALSRAHVVSVVGYADGQPAAAAQTLLSHGIAGVYWVGTIEAALRSRSWRGRDAYGYQTPRSISGDG